MMIHDLKSMTCAVCDIAKRAGFYIKKEREHFILENVVSKHAHDYVSYVDKNSEKLIVTALRELLPEAGFITEESSASYEGQQYYWVVDPLDGTTNFIHKNAPYCVSIALCREQEILVGCIYEVCADELFYAWKGGGAYLNDNPIHVSTLPFEEALVGVELPYDADAYRHVGHCLIDTFYGHVGAIRMNGSAAMSLCYVAAGRMDGWIEKYIGQWDFMAGALIVMEAGGTITDFSGNIHFLKGNEIVASNGLFHEKLLDTIVFAVRNSPLL
jgi:myo-inositol-1(or 4)-monophosphatase